MSSRKEEKKKFPDLKMKSSGQEILRPFNTFKPHDDECVISYIVDLAAANGMSYNDLLYKYKCSGIIDIYRKSEMILSDFGVNMTVDKIIEDLTIYPAVSGLVSWDRQLKIAAVFQSSFDKYNDMLEVNNGVKILNEKKICPMCALEDKKEYGHPYYHRSHQIPGVNACWKHHVNLITGKSMELFTNPSSMEAIEKSIKIIKAPLYEIVYARYARYILLKGLYGNNKKTSATIYDISTINYKSKEKIKDIISNHELKNKVNIDLNRLYWITTKNAKNAEINADRIYCPEVLLALLIIFCEDLLKNIDSWNDQNNRNASEVPEEYKILNIGTNLIYLEHDCGNKFAVPPEAFFNGFDCPVCDGADNGAKKFEQVMKKINSDFKLLTPFEKMNKTIEVQHKCGLKTNIKTKRLFQKLHCDCENYITEEQVKNLINNDRLELVNVKNGLQKNALVTCKCKNCGKVFTKKYITLAEHPNCPRCRRTNIGKMFSKNEKVFKKEFDDLVDSNEYEIVSYSSGKNGLKIIHKKCGYITTMSGSDFLGGKRCALCGVPHRTELNKYVKKASEGMYEIMPESSTYSSFVKNTITGEVVGPLKKRVILQEISRPTQSEILPLDLELRKKNQKIKCKSILDDVLYLINRQPYTDYNLHDIQKKYIHGEEDERISMCVTLLCRQNKIAKIGCDLYHSINDPKLDTSKILSDTSDEIKKNIYDSVFHEESFTIELIEGITFYPKDKIISAFIELMNEKKIIRKKNDTYVTAEFMENAYETPNEKIDEYINKFLSETPFHMKDIKLPGVAASSIRERLNRLVKTNILKKDIDEIYAKTNLVYDVREYIESPTEYIRYIIEKDVTKDYAVSDFVNDKFQKQNITYAINTLFYENELYRIGIGIYHSAKDEKFDIMRAIKYQSQSGKIIITDTHKKIVEALKKYEIVSLEKIYMLVETADVSKKNIKEALSDLENNKYIHRACLGELEVYKYGKTKKINKYTIKNIIYKSIKKCGNEGKVFTLQDVINLTPTYTADETAMIFNEIKKESKQIQTVSPGKYVLKMSSEEKIGSSKLSILFNVIKNNYNNGEIFSRKNLFDLTQKEALSFSYGSVNHYLRILTKLEQVKRIKTGFYKISKKNDDAIKEYIHKQLLPSDIVYEYLENNYMIDEVFTFEEIRNRFAELRIETLTNAVKKLIGLKKIARVSKGCFKVISSEL